MASYNRIFSRPETLSEIAPHRLVTLLTPHKTALTACGFTLPENGTQIDHDRLSHVLMSPEELSAQLPLDLIDALYVIADFSTSESLFVLLDALERKSIKIARSSDQSVIDVAVDAWLTSKECVLEAHLELYTQRPKSFKYLPRTGLLNVPEVPTAAKLQRIRPMLNAAFDKHHLALNPGITPYDRGDMIQFLVRRGDPLQRIGAFSTRRSCEVLNPERFDLVVYDKTTGDLRVNVDPVWLTELYRECFGQLLFASTSAFGKSAKFSLDVIRTQGASCLNHDDIPEIEWLKLVEIKLLSPGGGFDVIARPDVFAYFDAVGRQIPSGRKIAKAVFEVKFRDSKKTIRVSVYEPNRTSHLRDSHAAIIDKFLELREFVVDKSQPTIRADAETAQVLVDAGVAADVIGQLHRMGISPGNGAPVDRSLAS